MAYDISYTYDSAGNRLTRTDNLLPQTTTYTYDECNQIVSSQVGGSTTNYTYDANGNLVSDGTVTNTWDAENRRTEAVTPGDTVTYKYNADGLRMEKAEPTSVKRYLWDGQAYIAEANVNNVFSVVYTQQPGPFGRLLSHGTPKALHSAVWYHFDALGSTMEVTNLAQAVQESYRYEAFGMLLTSNAYKPPFLYVGELGYYWDEPTADYYLRARTYDPRMARFSSKDRVHNRGALSRYAYALNRPLVLLDPTGNQATAFDQSICGNSAKSDFDDRMRPTAEGGFEHFYGGLVGSLSATIDVRRWGPGSAECGHNVFVHIAFKGSSRDVSGADHFSTRNMIINSKLGVIYDLPLPRSFPTSRTWRAATCYVTTNRPVLEPDGSASIGLELVCEVPCNNRIPGCCDDHVYGNIILWTIDMMGDQTVPRPVAGAGIPRTFPGQMVAINFGVTNIRSWGCSMRSCKAGISVEQMTFGFVYNLGGIKYTGPRGIPHGGNVDTAPEPDPARIQEYLQQEANMAFEGQ